MARRFTNLSWISIAALSIAAGGTTALAQAVDAAPAPRQATAQTPAPAQDGQPQMVFDELIYDFGRIADDKPVEHKFRFTNKGTGTLVIQQPQASCGCTVPFMDKREYAPGESGEITVRFNPHGRRGTQNQRITINTNESNNPQAVLQVQAFVRTTIAFEPQSVNFGPVMAGQSAVQRVRVQGPAPDFEVTYASTNKGRIVRVEVLETRQTVLNGEEINESILEFTFNGRGDRGHFGAMSTVRTTSPAAPLADIYITAEIVGDLQVLPPRVNVGIVEVNNTFHRMFRVNSRTGNPFKIINVDHEANLPEGLDIQWRPAQEGDETSWQVDIRGQAPGSTAPINATLTIMTDRDDDAMLTVPVSGAVRPTPAPQPGLDVEVEEPR